MVSLDSGEENNLYEGNTRETPVVVKDFTLKSLLARSTTRIESSIRHGGGWVRGKTNVEEDLKGGVGIKLTMYLLTDTGTQTQCL